MGIQSIDAEDDQFAYRYDTQLLIEKRDRDLDEDEISDYITEHFEGKKKQQLVSEAFSEIERKAVEGISKEEMEGFLSVYQKIYANLLDEAGSSSINKKTDQ